MARYIKSFLNDAAIQTAINNGELEKPYVAYNGSSIDYNSKSVEETGTTNEIYIEINGTKHLMDEGEGTYLYTSNPMDDIDNATISFYNGENQLTITGGSSHTNAECFYTGDIVDENYTISGSNLSISTSSYIPNGVYAFDANFELTLSGSNCSVNMGFMGEIEGCEEPEPDPIDDPEMM